MTVSGSYDFSVSRDDIIRGALRVLGVLGQGMTPSAEDTVEAAQALNHLVKSWSSPNNPLIPGIKTWTRKRVSLTLSAKAAFTIKSSGGDLNANPPIAIVSANLRNTDGVDTPLRPMTMEEYEAIPAKSSVGTPTGYYYERGYDADGGTFYLNRIPSDITDTVQITYLRPIQDFDGSADTPDFPQEWYRALKYNLAVELAPEYGVEVGATLAALAQQSLAQASSFHPDRTVVFFEPERDD